MVLSELKNQGGAFNSAERDADCQGLRYITVRDFQVWHGQVYSLARGVRARHHGQRSTVAHASQKMRGRDWRFRIDCD